MSGSRAKQERREAAARRFKTHGSDWFGLPATDIPLNACVPVVAPRVEDAMSATEHRVFLAVRDMKFAKKVNGAKGEFLGYLCDPHGGYTTIALKAGVCRKTVRNSIRSLIKKGILRIQEVTMRGRQREKTTYFAPYFDTVLKAWRADPAIFKTALGHVVVRGRRRALMTVEDATAWQIDGRRAPRAGSGRGLSDVAVARLAGKRAPAPAAMPSEEDIAIVYAELQRHGAKPNVKDAIDLIRLARKDAADLAAQVVVQIIIAIGRDYKPSHDYPEPRAGWFLDRLPGYLGDWLAYNRPDPHARTG